MSNMNGSTTFIADEGVVNAEEDNVTENSPLTTKDREADMSLRVVPTIHVVNEDSSSVDASPSKRSQHELSKQSSAGSSNNIPMQVLGSGCAMQISKEELETEGIQTLLPPDGGWGWAIVFASFLCNVLVDGVCFSYGVMLPHMSSTFAASESVMSMGGSMLTGCYLLMGPITSALANKIGCRSVTMIGAVISCVAFFISAVFIRDVYAFVVVFGVIGGVGFGLVYLPAVVIVGFWFEKRRAFATGIAVCGSGIGTFLFAPLSEALVHHYSWRGALIIISALMLNCAAGAALFTPLDKYYRIRSLKRAAAQRVLLEDDAADEGKKKVREHKRGLIFQKILEEKERQRTTSQGSLDGWLITGKNELIPEPDDYNENPILSTNAINSIVENVLKKQKFRSRTRNTSLNEQFRLRNNFPQLIKDYAHSQASLPAERVTASAPHSELPSASSSQYEISVDPQMIEAEKQEITRQVIKEIGRPMNRKDVFYISTGSLMHIPEYRRIHGASNKSTTGSQYKSATNMQSYIQSVTSLPVEQQAGAPSSPVKSAIQQMLDLSILLSPTFALLLLSSVCTMIGFLPVYMFIKNYATSHGISDLEATWLVSVIGMTNTVGRVVTGWVSDRPWASVLVINNGALIFAGIFTLCLPFFNQYTAMLVYCGLFGLCIAAFASLRSILVVELMGLDRLTNAFGILLLFQGLGMIAGPPLAAVLGDPVSHYRYSFYMAGFCLGISGVLTLPLKVICRWERRRDEARQLAGSAPVANVPRGRSRIQQQQQRQSNATNGMIQSAPHLLNVDAVAHQQQSPPTTNAPSSFGASYVDENDVPVESVI